jgi:hypothetical protein
MSAKRLAFALLIVLISGSAFAQRLRAQATVTLPWDSLTTADLASAVPGSDFVPTITWTLNSPANITRFRFRVDQIVGNPQTWKVSISRTTASWPTTIPLSIARTDVGTYTTITGTSQTVFTGTGNMPAWVNLSIRVGLAARFLTAGSYTTTLTYTLVQP